ncbi:MAG TPA: enoyl-CoA hydratase/isomerase family protein [Burkholderiales bacterium]|nr:enoyl-CoA hydratase/isomerase family protein [Burkholderiales bacterium]
MSFTDGVKLDKHGTTLIVTMSNPGKRNAFHREMRLRMIDAMREAAADNAVRAIVLTGADGHFCSGADLSRVDMKAAPRSVASLRENMKDVHRLLRVIVGGARPVIAAVEGDAFGAGLSMSAACDRVFAAKTARFGAAFAKIGIIPDVGLLYTLPKRVGMARARDMMFLAAPFSGEEAHKAGLVDELTETGGALDAALAYAGRFADIPPIPITLMKAALATGITDIDDAMRIELDLQPIASLSNDCAEGIQAFKEKRKPVFTGT